MKKYSRSKFTPVVWILSAVVLFAALLAISAGPSLAQAGAVDVFWHALASGGAASGPNPAGAYTLNSAFGQTFSANSTGGQGNTAFEINSGFMAAPFGLRHVFLPLVQK